MGGPTGRRISEAGTVFSDIVNPARSLQTSDGRWIVGVKGVTLTVKKMWRGRVLRVQVPSSFLGSAVFVWKIPALLQGSNPCLSNLMRGRIGIADT